MQNNHLKSCVLGATDNLLAESIGFEIGIQKAVSRRSQFSKRPKFMNRMSGGPEPQGLLHGLAEVGCWKERFCER
jgi:hypothetical protein